MSTTPLRPVRFRNFLAYGSNDFLGAGAMAVISGWTLFFFTTFCGLSAWEAASIFAIARIFDAIASPLIGFASDHFYRTKIGQRFGRRRFFVLAAIPLLPSFALIWVDGQSYWYYLVVFVFFEVVYAMEIIPYETLAAEMSPDYKVKAKFAGARILCGQISAILAGFLPGQIIQHFGKSSAETFLYLGIIFSVIFVFVAAMVYLFSWERSREEVERNAPPRASSAGEALKMLYRDLGSTLRIRAFRLHLGMYLGGYISQDIFNAAFTYFVVFALGSTVVVASKLLGTLAVMQLIAVSAFIPMCMNIGPGRSYRLAVTLFGLGTIGYGILYFVAPGNMALWIFAPALIAGLGRGGLNYIPWNTYNYMADVDEIVTGRRREGAFAGVMTFIRKATQSAAIMSVGLIMDLGGFVQKQEVQSPEAVHTIVAVLLVGTLVVLALGFIVSLRFHLNRETHEILMAEIRRFKEQPGTEPSAEHRRIVEDLSGWPYAKLWGKNTITMPEGHEAPVRLGQS
jgi:oligogalacturonide transporter